MSIMCPVCSHSVPDDARFCEACGAQATADPGLPILAPLLSPVPALADTAAALVMGAGSSAPSWGTFDGRELAPEQEDLPTRALGRPMRPCSVCGGGVAEDGYCTQCGERAESARDHWSEEPAAWVAGVCDRGVRHTANEDAMALTAEPEPGSFAVLVVCDGVSTARNSDVASLAAATAARTVLADGGPNGEHAVTGEVVERMATWSRLLDVAAEAANEAIVATTDETSQGGENPPSCTYVAAVVDGPLIVVGWLGDSRAYWLPDAGRAHQLSVDDSWAQELVLQGMSRASAEAAPGAHAITRWLGPDTESTDSQTAATFPKERGWLLVCSDGLWNYCSPAAELAELLHTMAKTTGSDPSTLAQALVAWANLQGGQDNVTVALARLEPADNDRFDTLPDDMPDEEPAASTTTGSNVTTEPAQTIEPSTEQRSADG